MSVFRNDVLQSETALVTGATGGIGSNTAEILAEMGASLVLTGRDADALTDVESTVTDTASKGEVLSVRADITDDEERAELLNVASGFGDVSLLVNAAGIGGDRTPFEDLPREQITEVMQVNFEATVLTTREVYDEMRSREDGTIVNVASLSGLRGTYRSVPYCASKFALVGFTQSLALEAIEYGVRVNAVCPGWVDTSMGHDGIGSKAAEKGRDYAEQLERERETIPSGRITTPEEVANAIAFLLTDAGENVVGESLKISGGSVL